MRNMIGVDVGGTFTDLTLVDIDAQAVYTHKVLSTPSDPSVAIMKGIAELLAREHVPYNLVDYLAHGTTVATNALIEKKGAKTGLLVTEGFRDLLEIGRQVRPSLYDLQQEKPTPLVQGQYRKEVTERVYFDGQVRTGLDENTVRQGVSELREAGVRSIAICFLFSYINPQHERAAAQIVRDMFPEAYVSVSHEVVPEFREFPRLSTTVLNAYLGPVMETYLTNFNNAVHAVGIEKSPYITQSNGGILSIEETIQTPVRTAVSGPSAGVVAAAHIGEMTGLDNLLTLDLGGTSADISLIYQGEPLISVERTIEGWPSRIPMLDIVTIGAGGGSIAWIDDGGALKVGPQSAGASPGPACYGFGGTQPTVTDANVVLGRMNPERILGGSMALDTGAASTAIETQLEARTDLSNVEAANGIIDVVNANMVRAMRLVSVERGYDPREFTLMAFGGAGPLHAVAVAQELGIPQVLIPPSPGTLCSLGLLVTDIRTYHVRSLPVAPTEASLPTVAALFDELTAEGQAVLDKEGVLPENRRLTRWIEARYQRQNYELSVPIEAGDLTAEKLPDLIERFHAEHARLYDYARPGAPIEFVNYRLAAVGILPKAPVPRWDRRAAGESLVPVGQRPVYFKEAGAYVPCDLYQRSQFCAGDTLAGPAVVEQMDSTILIPPAVSAAVDEFGNMLIHITEVG